MHIPNIQNTVLRSKLKSTGKIYAEKFSSSNLHNELHTLYILLSYLFMIMKYDIKIIET